MHTLILVKYSTKLTFWLYFMKNEFDSPFAMNVLVKKTFAETGYCQLLWQKPDSAGTV